MGETTYDPMSAGGTAGIDRPGGEEAVPETQQIKKDIAHARADLDDTIDALQERLRPSHLVEQAKDAVKGATRQKVKALADQAGEAANSVAERTRDTAGALVDRIREHPMPAALAGIGLAVLFTSRRWTRRRPYGASSGATDLSWEDGQPPLFRRAYQKSSEANEMGATHRGSGRAAESARRGTSTLQQALRAHPMVFGLAALTAGVVVGLMLPATDVENEYEGEARDTMVEQAKGPVERTASQVTGSDSPA